MPQRCSSACHWCCRRLCCNCCNERGRSASWLRSHWLRCCRSRQTQTCMKQSCTHRWCRQPLHWPGYRLCHRRRSCSDRSIPGFRSRSKGCRRSRRSPSRRWGSICRRSPKRHMQLNRARSCKRHHKRRSPWWCSRDWSRNPCRVACRSRQSLNCRSSSIDRHCTSERR